jgi:hypothetical protein
MVIYESGSKMSTSWEEAVQEMLKAQPNNILFLWKVENRRAKNIWK